jgi:spermidine/putrescine-binding protein
VLDKFSKEFDVKVSLDTYASNEEMLAKIQAGATGYDLVFPSVNMNDIMLQLGLIQQSNGSVNTGAIALLPENIRNNPNINPAPEVRAKLQIFEDLGPDLKMYDRVWTRIKTT